MSRFTSIKKVIFKFTTGLVVALTVITPLMSSFPMSFAPMAHAQVSQSCGPLDDCDPGVVQDQNTWFCDNQPQNADTDSYITVTDVDTGQSSSVYSWNNHSASNSIQIAPGHHVSITMAGDSYPYNAWGNVDSQVSGNDQHLFENVTLSDVNGYAHPTDTFDVPSLPYDLRVSVLSTACYSYSSSEIYITAQEPPHAYPFPFSCGADQTVTKGESAYYPLDTPYLDQYTPQINVWMYTLEAGPIMAPEYAHLNYQNGWSDYASINTDNAIPGHTYSLHFATEQPWGSPEICTVGLTVLPLPPTVDLKFDGSDGPTAPNPPSSGVGDLSWTVANADSCQASMSPQTNVGWNGNWVTYSGNITASNMQNNTSYTYALDCSNAGGTTSDTVTVNVGPPPPPTIDSFQCQGSGDSSFHDSPCSTDSGTSALIAFTSSNATSCSLAGFIVGTNESGVSTGTLYNPPNEQQYGLFCANSGGFVSATMRIIVNPPPQPTISLTCTNSDNSVSTSCTIMRGSTTHLAWETSHCGVTDLTPGGPVDPNNTAGLDVVVNQNTNFDIACNSDNGYPGSVTAFVQVNVVDPPPPVSFTNCAPSPLVIDKGGASGVISASVDAPGYSGGTITITPSFDTSPPANPPSFSYANNPQSAPGTTSVIVTADSSATPGTFTLTLTATGSGIATSDCFVTLTVNGNPPQPPDSVQANADGTCATITTNWQRPAAAPVPDYYQVYRLNAQSVFVAVGPHINDPGLSNGSFSYTDTSPLFMSSPNTYGVKSVSGSLESGIATSNTVIPTACVANMSQSDKDLYAVGNNVGSSVQCDNISDTFVLANQGIFIANSKLFFHINVCNTGSLPLTGIHVVENQHLNLTNIQRELSPATPCVASGTGEGPYYLNNLQPKAHLADPTPVCTVVVSATLTTPVSPATYLYRFYNGVTIYTNELPPKIVTTPKYLFSPTGGGGSPVRKEGP